MSTFNPLASAQSAATPNTPNQEKKPATLWLNVGVTVKNDKGEDEFIQLPVGIPLDNTKELSNTTFNATKLALLNSFLALAKDIPPGGTKDVPKTHLTMQIHRRVDANVPVTSAYDFSNIFATP